MASADQSMYLSLLKISNFRSLAEVEIEFQPGITLLAGENNSGKSSVLEALRLATTPLGGRRTQYFEESDFADANKRIEIGLEFHGLSRTQRGLYMGGLNLENNRLNYEVRCRPFVAGQRTIPVDLLSGSPGSPDLEPETRGGICHVYLAPLRDAKRELDSFSGNRLFQVMRYLCSNEELEEFRSDA